MRRPSSLVRGARGPRAQSRRSVLLVLVLGTLAVMAGPPSEARAQAPNPEVVDLTFEGNESFSSGALASAILTRETRCRTVLLQPFCWAGADFAEDRSFFSTRRFRDDFYRIQLFYYQRGFREAGVDTSIVRLDDERVALHFRISEGRPVRITSLEVSGLEDLDPADAAAVPDELPVELGDPLNLILLDEARDTIQSALRNTGYAHADVLRNLFIPTGAPYEAEVEFDVYTGPRARFGPIEVVGNEKVDDDVILRMLPFEEGSPYSREQIFAGQRNLFGLEIFRHAAIQEDRDHLPDSVVPVRVQVNEGDTYRVRTGAGWSTAECFNTDNRWSSRNFFGGARRLVVRGRVSNLLTSTLEDSLCREAGTGVYGQTNWALSTDFTQPWIFSPRNSFSAGLFFERQSLQDVFVRQSLGLNLGLTRSISPGTSLSFSYRPQFGSLDAAEIFFCTSFLVCDPEDIDVLQASNWLSPVALSFARDRRDQPLAPTTGYHFVADLEHAAAWTGSDFAYERLITEGAWYRPLGAGTVFATRLRGGFLNTGRFGGVVAEREGARIGHPQKRFFSGGANSVRGFAQNQLGPRLLTVGVDQLVGPRREDGAAVCTPREVRDLTCDAGVLPENDFFSRPAGGNAVVEGNVELRFLLPDSPWRAAAYVDFGQVFPEPGDVSPGRLEFTPGVGIRYNTLIGPVRLDLAYRLSDRDRLPVVTSQLRPFDPRRDQPADRVTGPDGEPLDYVPSEELAVLEPRVPFGEERPWSFRRLQIHFSIGEAF